MHDLFSHYRALLLTDASASCFRAEALDQLGGLMGRW